MPADPHELDNIYDHLRTRLSTSRFHHTMGVAFVATSLALRSGVDVTRALIAALLHDLGKEEDRSDQRAHALEAGLFSSEDERHPAVWHAAAAAVLARKEFQVNDPDILLAIRTHSTSDYPATPLQRLLFLADYIEPGRAYDGSAHLCKIAARDPDEAYRRAVLRKTDHLQNNGRPLHPRSARARRRALEETTQAGRGETTD